MTNARARQDGKRRFRGTVTHGRCFSYLCCLALAKPKTGSLSLRVSWKGSDIRDVRAMAVSVLYVFLDTFEGECFAKCASCAEVHVLNLHSLPTN